MGESSGGPAPEAHAAAISGRAVLCEKKIMFCFHHKTVNDPGTPTKKWRNLELPPFADEAKAWR